MLKGPQGEEQRLKAAWRKVAIIYCSTTAPPRGESASQGLGKLCAFSDESVYFAEEQYQQLWFPAYGLLPAGTMPARHIAKNPPGWNISPDLLSGSY